MVTGALIGWKGSKPSIIEAGRNVGEMDAKFKSFNLALANNAKCDYDLVEFYKGAFKKAVARKTSKAKELL